MNFPWDFWQSWVRTHADHEWWQFVSAEYADTARYYSPASYMNPQGANLFNGVTHGGDWYTVSGSRQDYMNYYANLRELTLELSYTKLLPAVLLEDHWQYNARSLINYMKQVTYGLHGVVADKSEGRFLQAAIEIPGYDIDESDVISSPLTGHFYRPLAEGTYHVTISAPGYPRYAFEALAIENHQRLLLDADLGMIRFDPLVVTFPPAVSGGYSQAILRMKNTTALPKVVELGPISNEAFMFALPLKNSLIFAPGEEKKIPVFFAPDRSDEFSGDLSLILEADWKPVITIPLNGVAPAEAALVESADPYLHFGRVALGQNRDASLSIRNSGNISLEMSDVVISGDAFTLKSTLPFVLAAGEFYDIQLSFQPDSVGAFNDSLAFVSNAYAEPPSISLIGEGVDDTHASIRLSNHDRLQVFPNPLSLQSTLTFPKSYTGPSQFIVSDLRGKQWLHLEVDGPPKGSHVISLGPYLSGLPAGVYMGRFVSASSVETIKLIKADSW